jgi:hypothetical protein
MIGSHCIGAGRDVYDDGVPPPSPVRAAGSRDLVLPPSHAGLRRGIDRLAGCGRRESMVEAAVGDAQRSANRGGRRNVAQWRDYECEQRNSPWFGFVHSQSWLLKRSIEDARLYALRPGYQSSTTSACFGRTPCVTGQRRPARDPGRIETPGVMRAHAGHRGSMVYKTYYNDDQAGVEAIQNR